MEPHRAAPDQRRGERRRDKRFVLRERRSGYDRRKDSPGGIVPTCVHVWCREHAWLLPAILIAANLLSLADIALTLRVLEAGAVEVNPLISALLEVNVHLAATVKAVLVAAASLLIWHYRWHRRILPLALVVLTVFAAVVAYQGMLLLAA